MNMEVVLSIVGFFGTMALTVNGFFLRGIFKDMGEVKVKLAEIVERSKAKEDRITKNEKDIETIFKIIDEMKEKHHDLRNICATQEHVAHLIEGLS